MPSKTAGVKCYRAWTKASCNITTDKNSHLIEMALGDRRIDIARERFVHNGESICYRIATPSEVAPYRQGLWR